MQKKEVNPKINRVLDLYERLNKGEIIDSNEAKDLDRLISLMPSTFVNNYI